MSRTIPNMPTPGGRDALDTLLADKRDRRRGRQDSEADLEYRLLSRAVGLLDLNEIVGGIEQGNQDSIDRAVEWLELDPFCMFSGYAKQRLLRALRKPKLSTRQATRLRDVVLEVLKRGPRQEFRELKRLARRLDSPDFRRALSKLQESSDQGIVQRATWILNSFKT